ncbi:MAG TPA: 4-alpha-glucanotransferase [Chthoniobacterales bacterium]|nr:4-alpha-glucanotransferase [Chthoniobacterales bacterium]
MEESQSLTVGHSGARITRSPLARIDRRTRLIDQRLSGVLLHISSLPGPFGIGDLGSSAYEFVDFLCASGQSIWSVLPLNAVLERPDFCPYSPTSAFATNSLLISPEKLLERGFLEPGDLQQYPNLPNEVVDFPKVVIAKANLLRQAFERFRMKADEAEKEAFRRFCDSRTWLPGYATYVTRGPLNGKVYRGEWQRGDEVTRPDLSNELDKQVVSFGQFIFFEQWKSLKQYANKKGIYIAGDIPYNVAFESCDLWESPQLFEVDPITGMTTFEAGAPPDEFVPKGQGWGNPTYAWSVHQQDGFKWWRTRIAENGALYDAIRLDHFRGFEAFWAIPAGSQGSTDGYFVRGPGRAFFEAIRESASSAEMFVEDLGFITDEVHALRESLGLPGMSVLQLAFNGQKNHPYLPYKCLPATVIYTETHDLKPMVGWFRDLNPGLKKEVEEYLGVPVTEGNVHWEFIRLALSSVASWALIPVQDLLGLGNEARMNITGVLSPENWRWRLTSVKSLDFVSEQLFNLSQVYGRLPIWR